MGLSTLAVSLGEESDTIEDVYEPYLLQLGFIQRTPLVPAYPASVSPSSDDSRTDPARSTNVGQAIEGELPMSRIRVLVLVAALLCTAGLGRAAEAQAAELF